MDINITNYIKMEVQSSGADLRSGPNFGWAVAAIAAIGTLLSGIGAVSEALGLYAIFLILSLSLVPGVFFIFYKMTQTKSLSAAAIIVVPLATAAIGGPGFIYWRKFSERPSAQACAKFGIVVTIDFPVLEFPYMFNPCHFPETNEIVDASQRVNELLRQPDSYEQQAKESLSIGDRAGAISYYQLAIATVPQPNQYWGEIPIEVNRAWRDLIDIYRKKLLLQLAHIKKKKVREDKAPRPDKPPKTPEPPSLPTPGPMVQDKHHQVTDPAGTRRSQRNNFESVAPPERRPGSSPMCDGFMRSSKCD